jgi:hypothetical protein
LFIKCQFSSGKNPVFPFPFSLPPVGGGGGLRGGKEKLNFFGRKLTIRTKSMTYYILCINNA